LVIDASGPSRLWCPTRSARGRPGDLARLPPDDRSAALHRAPGATAHDWYRWLLLRDIRPDLPRPAPAPWLADEVVYVLEVRSGFEPPDTIVGLPFEAEKVSGSEHFTLYRLSPGALLSGG